MALEGNLSAFGLSEIFQLIAVQQKSGMLTVNSENQSMVMFFRNGFIVSTRDRRRRGYDPLKDYLTNYGIVSQTDLMRIMDISTKSKLDMTEVIVSENFLSKEEMRRHYRNQIQEAMHEILTWEQCHYKFIPSEQIASGLKIWGEFKIEGILMESMRRIDEFPQILKEFPNETMIILRSGEDEPEDLTPNEQIIYELLICERTIEYLTSHGKMPTFEVYETLKHLKEKGLIETRGDKAAEADGTSCEKSIGERPRRSPKRFVTTGLIFIFFSLSFFAGARSSLEQLKPQAERFQNTMNEETLARDRMEEKLRWILEGYCAEYGKYPQTLSELSESNFVTKEFMENVKHFSFRYYLTPGKVTYTLI